MEYAIVKIVKIVGLMFRTATLSFFFSLSVNITARLIFVITAGARSSVITRLQEIIFFFHITLIYDHNNMSLKFRGRQREIQ